MIYIKLFEQHSNQISKESIIDYIGYFEEKDLDLESIHIGGKGEYSTTYIITTSKGDDYALNVRDEGGKSYEVLIGDTWEYLPDVYDVRKAIDGKYCIVMEVLKPISKEYRDVIDAVDFLFYLNDEDGLDVWLENNEGLLETVREYLDDYNILEVPDNYLMKLKWLKDNITTYAKFISIIEHAFIEYKYTFGYSYVDFHGENMMMDRYGNYKLIDL